MKKIDCHNALQCKTQNIAEITWLCPWLNCAKKVLH